MDFCKRFFWWQYKIKRHFLKRIKHNFTNNRENNSLLLLLHLIMQLRQQQRLPLIYGLPKNHIGCLQHEPCVFYGGDALFDEKNLLGVAALYFVGTKRVKPRVKSLHNDSNLLLSKRFASEEFNHPVFFFAILNFA